MKKLSTKLVAILLAVMMVMTSAPYAAMASTTAANSVLSGLSDAITAYRTKMGKDIYTNMSAAYTSYIAAVKVYDKAKYGAENVTEADINAAKNDLIAKTDAMVAWTPSVGNVKPTASTKAFSDDGTNLSSVTNRSNTLGANYLPSGLMSGTEFDNTGNNFLDDVYSWGYQKLAYVETNKSSTNEVSSTTSSGEYASTAYNGGFKSTKDSRNFSVCLYVPNAIIVYDGSDGFRARVGVMAKVQISQRYDRRISKLRVDGNQYFHFGDFWGTARANHASGCSADEDAQPEIAAVYQERYTKLDFVNAVAAASYMDKASGTDQEYAHGTRTVNNSTIYIGNCLEFTVPESDTIFNGANAQTSYTLTQLPVETCAGAVENDVCNNTDKAKAGIKVKIDVLNYKMLLNKIKSKKSALIIDADHPYLEGGLSNLITAINSAMTWTPSGSNISTMVSEMNAKIAAIDNATVTADDSPYGSLGSKMESVLASPQTGATELGDWYNVNNFTDDYSDSSIEAFVTAFTYAQSIFDQNTNFADSYSFSAQNVTVGSGDTAKTVSVPAATKTVQQVYDMLMAAQLEVSERVDASTLIMYIEELTVALQYSDAFGIKGSTTESSIQNAVENAKYQIWGETTVEWDDPNDGTHHTATILNYPNPAKLPKDSAAAQRKVAQQVAALKPYIEGLAINPNKNIVYNALGDQNSLGKILSDMADTNLYPRGDYVNGDTLDEAINYVNNNFIPQVVPNQNTQIVSGIVLAKVNDYKSYIQYCQDVIDNLMKTFLALDNGTVISEGVVENLTPSAIEKKWSLRFSRYNNVVVFRTTKQKSTLNLGAASLTFYQTDTTAWGSNNEYHAVLDSISINDTAGGSNSIRKENAISTSELPSVELTAEQCAQYPGKLSMDTTNGGIYGVANFVGKAGKPDGSGGILVGKAGEDGSLTSGLAVTDGTMNAASGIWAYDGTTTLVAGNAYLDLPQESAVTLTRTTTPKMTTYTNTGYFGSVFYWTADGAGVSAIKNVYNGYYHERTDNTYTQNTTVIDISNLKDLVTVMNTLNKSDYTEASWNAMKTKLAAAASNDFGSGKTFREVTTAQLNSQLTTRYQQLYDSWKALIPAATNIELTRPVAQAQNEGKDIGAVVRANDNLLYTKRQTNNDVTAENTYGTYTTNTWNDFQTAYDAGDVAIFGDGTNAGQYATPTFDTNGNTLVVGTRQYPRFKNSDGDPLDVGDLDALGLTINDMEAIEQASGVSLSDEQAAINQMAANIRNKYAALKKWANFVPVDSAMDVLSGTFQSNYDRVYTTDSLKAINTAFAAAPISTNKFYQIANDDAAQHALVNGVAKYDEDDDAAIAAEADAINATIPPVASTMDQGYYTAASIIAMAEDAASDPDAYDAEEAVALATTLAGQLFETVNIAPLANKPVEGVNFVDNDEIDAQLNEIMTHVSTVTYDVVVKNAAGTTIATYEDQPYGTQITLNSSSGEPVVWTYNYTSRTVKNHNPTTTGVLDSYTFVVVGDTTITEGGSSSQAGYQIAFNDSLNHVYAIEYVQPGATITYSGDKVIIDNNGTTKEISAPNYAFYNFKSYKGASSTPVDVTQDMTVIAQYEAIEDYIEAFTLTVVNEAGVSSDFYVPYNTKITIDPDIIANTGTSASTAGRIIVNGEEERLEKKGGVSKGSELYCMTYVEEGYETWSDKRDTYSEDAMKTEIPFKAVDGEFNFYVGNDATILLYEDETTYQTAISDGFVVDGPKAFANDTIVLANNKFTMHGKEYLPDGNTLIECGMLMYIGEQEIAADDLTLQTYKLLPGAYRLKYTKSTKYGNINVSFLRKAADGTPYFSGATRVRYRTFLTYKDSSDAIHTVYSNLADDTQNM